MQFQKPETTMKEFKPLDLFKEISDNELMTVHEDYLHQKTILGIDIYRYSQYPLTEQIYIPVLFETLYNATTKNLMSHEKFFFSRYKKTADFKKDFISTGDGGFQIFDNPVEALIFALVFQMNVKRFVSGSNTVDFRKKLHKIISDIELRYAITFDTIYSYNSNFFGAGIINNARILSKDSLNRLLVDNNTINWFTNNLNSVENLVTIDKNSFVLTDSFKDYDTNLHSAIFDLGKSFKSVIASKIGSISAKETRLDIYNLYCQALFQLKIDKHDYNDFVITLGNINPSGIQ